MVADVVIPTPDSETGLSGANQDPVIPKLRLRKDALALDAVRNGGWWMPAARSEQQQQQSFMELLTTIPPPSGSGQHLRQASGLLLLRTCNSISSWIIQTRPPHQVRESSIVKLILQAACYVIWCERNARSSPTHHQPPLQLKLLLIELSGIVSFLYPTLFSALTLIVTFSPSNSLS